jgi:transcriptional regulator with XRE-family HTH domain
MPGGEVNLDFGPIEVDEIKQQQARRVVCCYAIGDTDVERRVDAAELLAMLGLLGTGDSNGACSDCERPFSDSGMAGTVRRRRDGLCSGCYDRRRTGAGLVKTQAARDHVDELRKTMTLREISDASNVSLGTLSLLRRQSHAQAATVERLLAIDVPTEPRSIVCASCGTRFQSRRHVTRCQPCILDQVPVGPSRDHIARQHAAGMTYRRMSELVGVSKSSLSTIAHSTHAQAVTHVGRDLAARILALTADDAVTS